MKVVGMAFDSRNLNNVVENFLLFKKGSTYTKIFNPFIDFKLGMHHGLLLLDNGGPKWVNPGSRTDFWSVFFSLSVTNAPIRLIHYPFNFPLSKTRWAREVG